METTLKLCQQFLDAASHHDIEEMNRSLADLRKAILFHGIDGLGSKDKDPVSGTLRGTVWKLMLAVDKVDADEYIELIKRKECRKEEYGKIRSDSFRTFASDKKFRSVVKETESIRVLNCFVHRYFPAFTYCQGMNAICGPFVYCLPEVDAYFTFCKFLTKKFPLYWICNHIGAQAGCMLVDQVLAVVDPTLFGHLQHHRLHAYVYAFSCVSSLSASVPPFKELLRLWDFLIAFGPHLNILCVVGQILSLRELLLKSDTPKSILDYRYWPKLQAKFTIAMAMSLLPQIPKDLYEKICLHGIDPTVASQITGRDIYTTHQQATKASEVASKMTATPIQLD